MDQTVVSFPSPSREIEKTQAVPQDYLDPIEAAIVRAFLRGSPRASEPPEAWFDTSDAQDHEAQPVRLQRLDHSEMNDIAVRNAVARICLNAVQARLPQWGMVNQHRQAILGRHLDDRRNTGFDLAPQHLFTLNWADSGPGFSWPEAYHVTFLPGFDRWVLTMSVDSPDVWDCTDIALGSFRPNVDLVRASGRVIIAYWRKYQCYDPGAGGWAYLFDVGLVNSETAHRWRRRVWKTAVQDDTESWA